MVHMMSLFCAGHVHSGQWTHWTVSTVDTVFSLVVRVTFPTLAASLPPAAARHPRHCRTATDARSLDISSKY